MVLTAHFAPYVDECGKHDVQESRWETNLCPGFGSSSECFVIYKNWRGKYQIKECRVASCWFTNIWGWRLSNGWCFCADEYGETIFSHDELQKAIELCEKKNRMRKVKVVRMQ